jgi:uncharacterized protein (TIGR02118 family)
LIKVNFLYSNVEGSTFDMDYYVNVHVPLAKECYGDALKGFSIDSGISGIMPDSEPPFHVIGAALFDSVEAFYEAIMPHMETMRADSQKYASHDPIIQISKVAIES